MSDRLTEQPAWASVSSHDCGSMPNCNSRGAPLGAQAATILLSLPGAREAHGVYTFCHLGWHRALLGEFGGHTKIESIGSEIDDAIEITRRSTSKINGVTA
jgi:hypothetical protein